MKLLKFYATWCGPCKMVAPALSRVADEASLKVQEVDIDKQPDLVVQYGVQGVPTIIKVDDDGKELARVVGARPVRVLKEELNL